MSKQYAVIPCDVDNFADGFAIRIFEVLTGAECAAAVAAGEPCVVDDGVHARQVTLSPPMLDEPSLRLAATPDHSQPVPALQVPARPPNPLRNVIRTHLLRYIAYWHPDNGAKSNDSDIGTLLASPTLIPLSIDQSRVYTVSAIDGRKHAHVLGPFADHLIALLHVTPFRHYVREHLIDANPQWQWIALGTAGIPRTDVATIAKVGRFNFNDRIDGVNKQLATQTGLATLLSDQQRSAPIPFTKQAAQQQSQSPLSFRR